MNFLIRLSLAVSLILATVHTPDAAAQSMTEEKFQDLFTTAGYATAFGAAMGAAFLSFHQHPENHLRYIAVGASLGFIGGSLMGTYFIFAPSFLVDDVPATERDILAGVPDRGILIRPNYNTETRKLSSVETGMTLFRF